jgi:hypothetical protein
MWKEQKNQDQNSRPTCKKCRIRPKDTGVCTTNDCSKWDDFYY